MQLSHLVVQHPQVPSKETCQECLTDLKDKRALIERDDSLSASQKKRQLEEKDRQIHRLYWKTSKKASERLKHFAFCRFQASDIKAACRQVKNGGGASSDEGKDGRGGKPRTGNARAQGKAVSSRSTHASSAAAGPSSGKRLREDDEQEEGFDSGQGHQHRGKEPRRTKPIGSQMRKRETNQAHETLHRLSSTTRDAAYPTAFDESVEEGEEHGSVPAQVPHPLQAERLSVEPPNADFSTYFASGHTRISRPAGHAEQQSEVSDADTEDSLPSRSVSREATSSTAPTSIRTCSASRSLSIPTERNPRKVNRDRSD